MAEYHECWKCGSQTKGYYEGRCWYCTKELILSKLKIWQN